MNNHQYKYATIKTFKSPNYCFLPYDYLHISKRKEQSDATYATAAQRLHWSNKKGNNPKSRSLLFLHCVKANN